MRYFFSPILLIFFALVSISVNAANIDNQNMPEGIVTYLHNKHPNAEDVTIEEKTHFGHHLYEVRFKENKTDNNKTVTVNLDKLFRTNGDFFTNVYPVEHHAYNVMSDEAKKSLQSHYPGYKILSMNMISNPNGLGDEYEIELMVSGKVLNVTVNNYGDLISETEKRP